MKFLMRIKTIVLMAILAIFLMQTSCKSSQTAATDSPNFIAPGYKKQDYKKILVIALLQPERNKKQVEDAIVSELSERRYPVHASYKDFPEDLKTDTANLRKKVTEAGYDAAIVLTYLGQNSTTQEFASYDGTFFSIFYGYYVTIDIDTQNIGNAFFQCDFFTKDSKGTQWRAPIRVNTSNDRSLLLQMIARNLRLQIVSDKII